MSESSTEAIVAGEAAQAAVEEVQSREALNDTVAVTAEVAATAEVRAEVAEETAETAVQAASEAISMTAGVADRVDEAQYTANAATDIASTAVQEAQEAKEVALSTDQKLDVILAHLERQAQPQTQEPTGVQEVEVHDNAPQTTQSSESEGTVESRSTRRRAGRLARREARRGNTE